MRGSADKCRPLAGRPWLWAVLLLGLAAPAACRLASRPAPPSTTVQPAASPRSDAAAEALPVAVEDDAAPWSNADGSGFANDLVRAVFAEAQLPVRLTVAPYARCKQLALDGETAACFSMSPAPELEGRIALADKPLFTCNADFFQATERALKATKPGDLPRGTRLGVVIGYEYPAELKSLEAAGVVVLEEAASEEINLRKLAEGRLDAALINHNAVKSASEMVKRAGVAGKVERAFPCGELKSFIGFSLRHPRGPEALAAFNAAFARLQANGGLAAIEKSWQTKCEEAAAEPTGPPAGRGAQ